MSEKDAEYRAGEYELVILAGHVLSIANIDIDQTFVFAQPYTNHVTINVERGPNDCKLFYIDGKCVGNVHGAVQEYGKIFYAAQQSV